MSPVTQRLRFSVVGTGIKVPQHFLHFTHLFIMFSMIISEIGTLREKAGFLPMLSIQTFGTVVNMWI